MSAIDHIAAEQALFLVALDDSDPERQRALAHAVNCSACRKLWQQNEAMLALLDREPASVEIEPALAARIEVTVLGKAVTSPVALDAPAALALEARAAAEPSSREPSPRQAPGQVASARGHASWQYIAWLAGAVCSAWLVWLQADAVAEAGLYADIGMRCLRMELGFALIAFGAGVLWTRGALRRFGPLQASVVAMSGALVGQLVLRVRCEAPDAALHLLVFHLLGVVIATVLGGAAGRLLSRAA